MSGLRHSDVFHCEVPGDLKYVSEAAALLKEYCDARMFDPVAWPSLEVGFCEALNNAIEHGCAGDPSKTVKLSWTWGDSGLAIDIEDPGNYQPRESPAALPEDPLQEAGRGQFIIQSAFDTVEHGSTPYGHRLSMSLSLPKPQSALSKLQETYESLQRVSGELNQSYAELSALRGFTNDIYSSSSLSGALELSLDRLRSAYDIEAVEVWLSDDGFMRNAVDSDCPPISLAARPPAAIVNAFRNQNEHIVGNCSELADTDPLYSESHCALISPIVCQRDCLGVIVTRLPLGNASRFETDLASVIQLFSQLVSLAIGRYSTIGHREENERARTQLEIAAEIQKSLLPSDFPQSPYCRITGRCVTAQAVGGDYIDAINAKDQGVLLIIADVMGKGVPAALLATIFRTAIRSRLNLAETPGWILSQINEQFHSELGHLNMFVTAQAAYFSYHDKSLKLASAGHCPALLKRHQSGIVEELNAEGLPLGIESGEIYEEQLIKLGEGDNVVFITDGIYEAENQSGEMLGIHGFSKQLPRIWQEGIDSVPENAFSVVATHSQGQASQDDKTLMAIEVL